MSTQPKQTEMVKGYKVTDSKMQCRGFQFELNKEYSVKGKVVLCRNGFHFCEIPNNCFEYNDFDTANRVFEIEAWGKIVNDEKKSCAASIRLVRELSWEEVLRLVNTGMANTGRANSGNWNSGDRNSGNWNSGDRNSGYRNSGDRNSGNWNSGYRNSGDRNSGDRNSGNWNSGDRNSGDSNSGNWNSGDRNSGDSNSGYRNSGAFCADKNPKIFLFDKPTDINVRDWENSDAVRLMWDNLQTTIWVDSSIMTDEEKKRYINHETTGGYLKTITYKEAWANMWGNLTDESKAVFTSLPNFDATKFELITGINVKATGEKEDDK